MPELFISELNIYPVKSMRQVSLQTSQLDMGGLKHDRRWMVVDVNGKMITQRQESRLCLVQPGLIDNGIRLSATGTADLVITVPENDTITRVLVWNDTCNSYDAGDDAAKWISGFLDRECRLVYFPDDEVRVVDQYYARPEDRTAFSDGFPVLLIMQSSLDDLNTRLESPIPMARFRPNVVISGSGPYAEDDWNELAVGDFKIRIVKPCSRCVIPSIDIETGERSKIFEPAKTLATYRRKDNKVFFGQNAVIDGDGKLSVGLKVEVIS